MKFKRTLQSSKNDFEKQILSWLTTKAPDIVCNDGVMRDGWLKEDENAGKEEEEAPTR